MFLYDSAIGYHLFKTSPELKLEKEYLFETKEKATEAIKEINKDNLPEQLKTFLEKNITSELIVGDEQIKNLLKQKFETSVNQNIYREIKQKFAKNFCDKKSKYIAYNIAIQGLELDTERQDIVVIQAIKMIKDLETDVNMHCMKIREWYSLHFPELSNLVADNEKYLKAVNLIKIKEQFENKEELEKLVGDKTNEIFTVKDISVGIAISNEDVEKICADCDSTLFMIKYKAELSDYLKTKMEIVAPNVTELVGEIVAAKLIEKVGGISELSKVSPSTIQVLGAEKALFSALKAKENTPKYGIIFHAPILSSVDQKNKGKIARLLACKIARAAAVDVYKKTPGNKFGKELYQKINRRIELLKKTS